VAEADRDSLSHGMGAWGRLWHRLVVIVGWHAVVEGWGVTSMLSVTGWIKDAPIQARGTRRVSSLEGGATFDQSRRSTLNAIDTI